MSESSPSQADHGEARPDDRVLGTKPGPQTSAMLEALDTWGEAQRDNERALVVGRIIKMIEYECECIYGGTTCIDQDMAEPCVECITRNNLIAAIVTSEGEGTVPPQ